jgi:diguanylate cyclase (GGDEF)-like protein
MGNVAEQLAELTGYKDRDVMDVTMVVAMRDMLAPLSVSIYRAVGSPEDRRWMTRARLKADDAVASADPLSTPLSELPTLDQFPARLACLQKHEVRESGSDEGDSTCYFPLLSEHDGDGVLEIVSQSRLTLAEQRTVSAIVKVYHNFQGLLDYSERDTLTGLLNRKTFDGSFLKLLAGEGALASTAIEGDRRHETAPAHWLGVIDIDHFKRVNDNFGHLIGDEVLLLLSRLMRASFRYHDRLYRFGGEEFVVLLRADGVTHAAAAFERLRQQCQQYAFPQVGQVTLSIGFTAIRPGDTPAGAFDRADKAVYHAKHNGRNQVHGFEQLVTDGHLQEEGDKESDVELF